MWTNHLAALLNSSKTCTTGTFGK